MLLSVRRGLVRRLWGRLFPCTSTYQSEYDLSCKHYRGTRRGDGAPRHGRPSNLDPKPPVPASRPTPSIASLYPLASLHGFYNRTSTAKREEGVRERVAAPNDGADISISLDARTRRRTTTYPFQPSEVNKYTGDTLRNIPRPSPNAGRPR